MPRLAQNNWQMQRVLVELFEQLLQIEKDESGLTRRYNFYKDVD